MKLVLVLIAASLWAETPKPDPVAAAIVALKDAQIEMLSAQVAWYAAKDKVTAADAALRAAKSEADKKTEAPKDDKK